jgi:hypothetical protein
MILAGMQSGIQQGTHTSVFPANKLVDVHPNADCKAALYPVSCPVLAQSHYQGPVGNTPRKSVETIAAVSQLKGPLFLDMNYR